jgi:hypothetical protein
MPLDVSPTATAEIRMGAGPAGRTPETVMQVRARSLGNRSVARHFPDLTRQPAREEEEPTTRFRRAGPSPRRVAPSREVSHVVSATVDTYLRARGFGVDASRATSATESRARACDRRVRETRRSRHDRD